MKNILNRIAIICAWVALCSSKSLNPYLPQSEFIVEREGYILAYDGRTKNACWVYERLTRQEVLDGNTERKHWHYKKDDWLPAIIRSTIEDYQKSGFDLGHLCPFADRRGHEKAAEETFYLSNVSPQASQLNRGHWRLLEELVRRLALQYLAVHVITMPLYVPSDGQVCYQVIGKNSVAVPTHFCKVIFAENGKSVDCFAYLLPNENISRDIPLEHFATTLAKIEQLSGIVFPNYANK